MLIFLIGYMGSGKTTTGKKLASRLNYPFMDTDHEIESRLGKDIPAIFRDHGEPYFRKQEELLLQEIFTQDSLVIATGGGLPCTGDHLEQMNRAGITIYLKMNPAALLKRLEKGKVRRPLIRDLSGKELRLFIEEQLAHRESYYSGAQIKVDALDLDINDLLEMIRARKFL